MYLKKVKKIIINIKLKKYFLFFINNNKDPINNAIDDCLKNIGNVEKNKINLFLLKIIRYETIIANENSSMSCA